MTEEQEKAIKGISENPADIREDGTIVYTHDHGGFDVLPDGSIFHWES